MSFKAFVYRESNKMCKSENCSQTQRFHRLDVINTLSVDSLHSSGIRTTMNGFHNDFRSSYCGWIDSRTSPPNVYRQPCKVDDCSIPTVTTQIQSWSHENTVNRAWLNAKCTEHAFRIVDRKARHLKAFTPGRFLHNDVNAVNGTFLRTLITGNTRREIKTMKSSISCRNRCREFRIFEVFCECFSVWIKSTTKDVESNSHTVQHSTNRRKEVAKPTDHGGHPMVKKEEHLKRRQEYIYNSSNATRRQTSKENELATRYVTKSNCIEWKYRVAKKDNKPVESTWHGIRVPDRMAFWHLPSAVADSIISRICFAGPLRQSRQASEFNSYQLSTRPGFFCPGSWLLEHLSKLVIWSFLKLFNAFFPQNERGHKEPEGI